MCMKEKVSVNEKHVIGLWFSVTVGTEHIVTHSFTPPGPHTTDTHTSTDCTVRLRMNGLY